MPVYRIIMSNTSETASCVHSTFMSSSNKEALVKLNTLKENPIFKFTLLWLELYDESTKQYISIKTPS